MERYWALVKRELKQIGKTSRNILDFKDKWNAATRRITTDTVKSLMAGIPDKVHNFINQDKILKNKT